MDPSAFRPLHRPNCVVACAHCNLREICLPVGLTRAQLESLEGRLVAARRKVRAGEALFRAGDRFDALFAVWTGFFKTVLRSLLGVEQVMGFQMAGELIGIEAIDAGRHAVDAIALEDSQVCVIRYDELAALAREIPPLQEQLHRLMSREIAAEHEAMLRLGSMYAEERLAGFLLNLMHRLEVRGFSPTSVQLRMTRGEIGSYLGLKLETVSRTLSRFQSTGLLRVRHRDITVTDAAGLRRILEGPAA